MSDHIVMSPEDSKVYHEISEICYDEKISQMKKASKLMALFMKEKQKHENTNKSSSRE